MARTTASCFRAVTVCILIGLAQRCEAQGTRPSTGSLFDSETISGLGARNIGSAAMSGRVAALDAFREGDRLTVFVGAASGGLWKSVNGGTTFRPVFDKQPVQSIGAVTIDRKNPKTVWVGTGESWTRNSVSIGDGIYRSTDGGETWRNAGLRESERIARILVDPANSDIVYAAVPGKLWSDGDERGLFKTTDGGKSWSRILKGPNPSTGCSMISMDSRNPGTIFAGMWDFRRRGWTFRSGGDSASAPSGSGLFKSNDGGESWVDLNSRTAPGLPPKPWGRIAVAVAPSQSKIVYALIEAEPPKNGLYRSDDGGETWQALDRSQNMVWRPFYFANLIVDPKDENKVYKPDLSLIASTNGGKSFSNIAGGAHGDFHDVWIDPDNTDHLITGDDGGLWYSYDAGNKWWKAENLPISQFYHVSVDMERPYRVYGGLQDNSAWVGQSRYPGGIANSQWENMYGGDGFWMFPDPSDPDYLYAESQGGNIGRINRRTHETRNIQPLPRAGERKLRFNWNTPIHVSPTQDGTIYIGAQFLFRSRDRGQTWDRISPDLTTDDPEKQKQEQSGGVTIDNSAAEMHTTIYAIAESPKNNEVIWAGTDDGNLQVTRNGGKSWRNVVNNIHSLPNNGWVSSIEAGHFDEGSAYVTFDYHMFGDMRPYCYRTTDFGETWTRIVAFDPGQVAGYAHVIREDPVDRNLLFLGTEFGLWITLDGGGEWARYKGGNFPSVAVRDMVIHPREHDLVIGTHGRGIWIIDDISPLRGLTKDSLEKEISFTRARPTVQEIPAWGGWAYGDASFVGPNSTGDAVITYYQKKRHIFGDLKMEVLDQGGTPLGTIPSSKRRGLNRTTWSMRLRAPRVPSGATGASGTGIGPRVIPGTYTVKLTKGKNVYSHQVTVTADPRSAHTAADRRAQFDLTMNVYRLLEEMAFTVDQINGVRSSLEGDAAKLPSLDSLGARWRTWSSQVDAFRKRIVATKEGGMITGEERLREFASELYGNLNGYDGRPSQTQIDRAAGLSQELAGLQKEFHDWTDRHLAGINSDLAGKSMAPIVLQAREEWEKHNSTR
jgi:photosystem II stability/assembly factor-like uncharacterized protein